MSDLHESIARLACFRSRVDPQDFRAGTPNSTRGDQVVRARRLVVYTLRKAEGLSYPELARVVGWRSHSGAWDAHSNAAKDYRNNPDFKRDADYLMEVAKCPTP